MLKREKLIKFTSINGAERESEYFELPLPTTIISVSLLLIAILLLQDVWNVSAGDASRR